MGISYYTPTRAMLHSVRDPSAQHGFLYYGGKIRKEHMTYGIGPMGPPYESCDGPWAPGGPNRAVCYLHAGSAATQLMIGRPIEFQIT